MNHEYSVELVNVRGVPAVIEVELGAFALLYPWSRFLSGGLVFAQIQGLQVVGRYYPNEEGRGHIDTAHHSIRITGNVRVQIFGPIERLRQFKPLPCLSN